MAAASTQCAAFACIRFALISTVVLAAVALPAPAGAITLPGGFEDGSVVGGLDKPTSVAFTPDGRMLIGGEMGTVQVYANGALVPGAALDLSAKVCSDQERGLMSVTVDPAFASNHYVYVYYTFNKYGGVCEYGSNGSTRVPVNRVSRFVLGDNNVIDPAGEVVLVDNIPAPEGFHIGADLEFGNDGFLYVSTGDGGCDYADPVWCEKYNDASRDQNVLLGKVLRITRDGAIPASNPYQGADSARCNVTGITSAGLKCRETFAWGLRNPFRLAFDPNAAGTRFYVNDVGEITWEEIDLGQAGADYGWNVREGHCVLDTTTCGNPPAGMTDPVFDYNHNTGCTVITGGAFVPNGFWPAAYDGSYLYADMSCGKIFKLSAGAGGPLSSSDFASGLGDYSIVDMLFGPYKGDPALYYISWNAPGYEVRRIAYTGTPRGYVRPKGATPVTVSLVPNFNGCGSGNRRHGNGLASASCNPAAQSSGQLTVGTPDANGNVANSSGYARFDALPGNTSTTPDEADVRFALSLTDVRRKSDLADYGGELQATTRIRVTDRDNTPTPSTLGSGPGTVVDLQFPITVPCASTGDATVGSTCTVSTTADSVVPAAIREGVRTIWELGQVQVFDGGPDGLASTQTGNTVFATQGLFIP